MAKNRTKTRRLMTVEIDISPKMTPAQVHAVFIIVPRFNITTLITMIEAMRIASPSQLVMRTHCTIRSYSLQ